MKTFFQRLFGSGENFPQTTAELTFIYTYYNQIGMLRTQLENWRCYPESLRKRIAFMLVDDCSRRPAAQLVGNPNIDLSIYRVLEDLYCNIGGARNLGTKVCQTKWMLHSDMDHVISSTAAEAMLGLAAKNERKIYKFQRIDPDTGVTKIHPGTMLLTPEVYWEVGGCDEDFVGNYGQTDIHFFKRADKIIETELRDDIQMVIHREGETPIDRSPEKLEPNRKLLEQKLASGEWSTDFLRFTWERQR